MKETPQTDSKFDDLLDIGKLLEIGAKSNIKDEHALDLSFISAVNVDNPHFSDDDDKKVKKTQNFMAADGKNSSVILSDSSFGDQITKLQKFTTILKSDIIRRLLLAVIHKQCYYQT